MTTILGFGGHVASVESDDLREDVEEECFVDEDVAEEYLASASCVLIVRPYHRVPDLRAHHIAFVVRVGSVNADVAYAYVDAYQPVLRGFGRCCSVHAPLVDFCRFRTRCHDVLWHVVRCWTAALRAL